MSKQEARLPERIEKAIEQYGMAAYRQEEVTAQAKVLRSAILTALDEARDEALADTHVKNCACCDSPKHTNHIPIDPRCKNRRKGQ